MMDFGKTICGTVWRTASCTRTSADHFSQGKECDVMQMGKYLAGNMCSITRKAMVWKRTQMARSGRASG